MNLPKKLVMFISVILLVACQTTPKATWHKNGASNQDFAKDEYPCLQEAQQRVSETYVPPTAYEYTAAESSTKSVTNWGLFNSCMKARGWSKKYQQTSNPPQTTTEQIELERIQTQAISTEEAFKKCIAPIKSSPSYRRLEKRFVMDPDDDPRLLEKMNITEHATEQEIKDIREVSAKGKPCEKLALEGYRQVHPEFGTMFTNLVREDYLDRDKIVNKELTVGEANQRTIARSAEASRVGQRIREQLLNQSHE